MTRPFGIISVVRTELTRFFCIITEVVSELIQRADESARLLCDSIHLRTLFMNDSNAPIPPVPLSPNAPAQTATAVAAAAKVNLPEFFAALGNPIRWEMVRMMAGGRMICARDCAAALGREFDGVSKHLRLLRGAGVVWSKPAQDRRFELYYIPETIRRADGVLDYGFCVVRATA